MSVVAAVSGLLSLLPFLPTVIRALLLALLVLVGPGAAVLCWMRLPASTAAIVVPSLGLAVVASLTAAVSLAGWWSPPLLLVLISAGCVLGVARALPEFVRDVRS